MEPVLVENQFSILIPSSEETARAQMVGWTAWSKLVQNFKACYNVVSSSNTQLELCFKPLVCHSNLPWCLILTSFSKGTITSKKLQELHCTCNPMIFTFCLLRRVKSVCFQTKCVIIPKKHSMAIILLVFIDFPLQCVL